MPTLAEIDKEYEKEQNRIGKRFKNGKLYDLKSLPVKPRRLNETPKIPLDESRPEDITSINY